MSYNVTRRLPNSGKRKKKKNILKKKPYVRFIRRKYQKKRFRHKIWKRRMPLFRFKFIWRSSGFSTPKRTFKLKFFFKNFFLLYKTFKTVFFSGYTQKQWKSLLKSTKSLTFIDFYLFLESRADIFMVRYNIIRQLFRARLFIQRGWVFVNFKNNRYTESIQLFPGSVLQLCFVFILWRLGISFGNSLSHPRSWRIKKKYKRYIKRKKWRRANKTRLNFNLYFSKLITSGTLSNRFPLFKKKIFSYLRFKYVAHTLKSRLYLFYKKK